MDSENISINEILTLKPLPQTILYCTVCKITFILHLKMNT
jgi:hypothetical protein